MDTRQQINELIDRSITDPYQRQNTAAVMRAVLKYLVQNMANLADDDLARWLFWGALQKSADNTQTIQEAIEEAVQALLHYRGKYTTLAALEAALPSANEGDYAHVDAGTGEDVEEYIWDSSDSAWVKQTGTSGITEQRVLELLGNYLPLVNPDGATVTYGTANKGKLSFYEGGFEQEGNLSATDQTGYYANGEVSANVPGLNILAALYRILAVHDNFGPDQKQSAVIPYANADTQGVLIRLSHGDVSANFDFRIDGTIHLNGQPWGGSPGSATPSTPVALTDAATLTVDLSKSDKFTLSKGNFDTQLAFSNPQNGKGFALFIEGANGKKITFPSGYTHHLASTTAGSVTLPASGTAELHGVILGTSVWWAFSAGGQAVDLSAYVQKADTARTVPSSGQATLVMDRDAFPVMGTGATKGQITGNLTFTCTNGVPGVEQLVTFESNGSAPEPTFANATREGYNRYKATAGAVNKLWVRCGQDKNGNIQYFYLWG